jgi:hypothetical protein
MEVKEKVAVEVDADAECGLHDCWRKKEIFAQVRNENALP